MLKNFLSTICCAESTWKIDNWLESAIEEIKKTVGNHHVILGLSGVALVSISLSRYFGVI